VAYPSSRAETAASTSPALKANSLAHSPY